mmetsp:Transcript_22741/g.60636  ORF Transcript_22741/g.60636 Transcript_22741/m.60636 type:complete len:223 (+) Transcript_22741:182-850(+)
MPGSRVSTPPMTSSRWARPSSRAHASCSVMPVMSRRLWEEKSGFRGKLTSTSNSSGAKKMTRFLPTTPIRSVSQRRRHLDTSLCRALTMLSPAPSVASTPLPTVTICSMYPCGMVACATVQPAGASTALASSSSPSAFSSNRVSNQPTALGSPTAAKIREQTSSACCEYEPKMPSRACSYKNITASSPLAVLGQPWKPAWLPSRGDLDLVPSAGSQGLSSVS